MDAVDQAIQSLRSELSQTKAPKDSLALLSHLQQAQEDFKDQGEALYLSLNVHDSFPELAHVNMEFVCILLLARDLKINIRKRAINSFLEWDKLDQAVGGKEQSLGTKLHQATQSAIAKRAPALMNAICKYNGYCATLVELHQEEWSVAIPEPLPVKLAELRESPLLMEDVWISKTVGERPRWLAEPKVCEGIRALLKKDRCLEEQRRLGVEADNLCRWFGRELLALQTALTSASTSAAWFEAHIITASSLKAAPAAPVVQTLMWAPAFTPPDRNNSFHLEDQDDPVILEIDDRDQNEEYITSSSNSAVVLGDNGEDNTLLCDFIFDVPGASQDDEELCRPQSTPVAFVWALP
ncbi:hypothetical protein C0991_004361, partial [Blastosporella zonata]